MDPKPCTAAVVGLGYVGLPLAVHLAKNGCPVLGLDIDGSKVEQLSKGKSYIPDVSDPELTELLRNGLFAPRTPDDAIRQATHIIVTVPTPLKDGKTPNLDYLRSASSLVAEHLQRGQTVIVESTTFPGTLEEVILPILSATGLKAGVDYYLGYSPERIDPGNRDYPLWRIPKVVSGYTAACLEQVSRFYGQFFERIVPVSNPKVAELCKLFENIQRLVNISLVNEMDILCRQMGIDFHETLRAAATKPYGYTPYWPGPGIGGHCIPVDPLYFQWRAGQAGLCSQLIQAAYEINQRMPREVVRRIEDALDSKRPHAPAEILLIGLAYKKDVNDLRESAAIQVFKLLLARGHTVLYHDPHVPRIQLLGQHHHSQPLTPELLHRADAVAVLTDHSTVDWELVGQYAAVIIDTRGVFSESRVNTA